MKILNLILIAAVLSVAGVSAQATRELQRDKNLAASEKRTALVIGNGAYADAPLKNPPNDANDVAAALKTLGFEVMSYTNLDQTGMKRAIREFGTKLRAKGGVGLFYYAGHGVQVKGTNYLIPIGAAVNTEEEVEYESVEAGLAIAQMESAKNDLNIVILDACRNNPFARSMRSADKGLASIDAPSGTLIAYSTAPGSVASDGTGRNGLYTQELLKYMRAPGASIEEVFKRVRVSVRGATTGQQTPWESSSLTGDFYFKASQTGAVTSDPTAYLESGMGYVRQQKLDLAIADLSKAIEIDPKFAEAYFRRGSAYNDQRKFELAIIDLTKVTELKPTDHRAYALRATIYCGRDETALAAADEKKVLELGGKLLSKCW